MLEDLKIVIMAGGRGKRLGFVEKPMIKFGGRALIEYVVSEAEKLGGKLYVAISRYTPLTRDWCLRRGIEIIETEGKSYSEDLKYIASKLGRPILFLPADIPFVTVSLLRKFLAEAMRKPKSLITLMVDRSRFPREIRGAGGKAPTGISLLKGLDWSWSNVVMSKFPELLDIDTWQDLRFGEGLLG